MNVYLWGAHAPPRAGDDALVIANFFASGGGYGVKRKHSFGEGAAATDAKQRPGFPTSTFATRIRPVAPEARALPGKPLPRHMT
jgi:hypothetical protein